MQSWNLPTFILETENAMVIYHLSPHLTFLSSDSEAENNQIDIQSKALSVALVLIYFIYSVLGTRYGSVCYFSL